MFANLRGFDFIHQIVGRQIRYIYDQFCFEEDNTGGIIKEKNEIGKFLLIGGVWLKGCAVIKARVTRF